VSSKPRPPMLIFGLRRGPVNVSANQRAAAPLSPAPRRCRQRHRVCRPFRQLSSKHQHTYTSKSCTVAASASKNTQNKIKYGCRGKELFLRDFLQVSEVTARLRVITNPVIYGSPLDSIFFLLSLTLVSNYCGDNEYGSHPLVRVCDGSLYNSDRKMKHNAYTPPVRAPHPSTDHIHYPLSLLSKQLPQQLNLNHAFCTL
jgi:hypothetical protein